MQSHKFAVFMRERFKDVLVRGSTLVSNTSFLFVIRPAPQTMILCRQVAITAQAAMRRYVSCSARMHGRRYWSDASHSMERYSFAIRPLYYSTPSTIARLIRHVWPK